MNPVPDPILPGKFLGSSRESNSGPLGWQSDVLTTIPNRWSIIIIIIIIIIIMNFNTLTINTLISDYVINGLKKPGGLLSLSVPSLSRLKSNPILSIIGEKENYKFFLGQNFAN